MKMLAILTAAVGVLVAVSGPSLAASRMQAQRSADAYSSYARDNSDNAFWAAPYTYGPNTSAPNGSTYDVQGRNPNSSFGSDRNLPYRGPVGTIRNDW